MVSIVRLVQALLPTPTEVGISLVIIGLGVALIPILSYLKLVRPKGVMGRIIWTIGAIALGSYGLIQTESGSYELRPVRKQGDGVFAIIDGGRVEIEEVPENWSRLGKQPFLITYRKSERLFADVLSDIGEALPDGGLDGQRGGYYSYIPDTSDDGYVIRVHRLLERLREAGGSRLADIAEEEGLREFGGNYDMSNMVMVAYVGSMAILGLLGGIWFVS